jgi:hypothetical protein
MEIGSASTAATLIFLFAKNAIDVKHKLDSKMKQLPIPFTISQSLLTMPSPTKLNLP